MEDFYSLYMDEEPDAKTKALALAQALAQKQQALEPLQQFGMLGQLSGDRVLSGVGGNLMKQAQFERQAIADQQRGLAESEQSRRGNILKLAMQRAELAAQAERARLDRASHERIGRAPPFVIVTGQDGGQYFVDPRNPSTRAMPVTAPDGTQLSKPDPNAEKRKQQTTEIEERFQNMSRALDKIETHIGGAPGIPAHGTWDATGSGNATLESLITDYATDMAKLRDPGSIAKENEVKLERKALGDPGFWTKNSTAIDLVKKARENIQQRRNEAYRVRGLTPPDGPAQSAPTGGSVRDQIAEMKAKGMTPEEIKKALKGGG